MPRIARKKGQLWTHAAYSAMAIEAKEDSLGDTQGQLGLLVSATAATSRPRLPKDIGFTMPPLHKKPVDDTPMPQEEALKLFAEFRENSGA